ncbi:MAG: 1,4-dihydroxy-2-naphthoate octaprenyltransferase [Deferribacterota bacterium]|nr:1,4-dihydroxy-2-naphthoate octaprenyltransferase [Deferribacterota bacterium]
MYIKNIKNYFIATRPWSFSMSFISVIIGSLLALRNGSISICALVLTLIGTILVHAASNVLNDYYDTKYSVDTPKAPTAKYRPHPIIEGYLSKREVLYEAIILYVLAFISGVILAVFYSYKIIYICILALLISIFYTGKPISLKYKATGELAVFVIWGPLMVSGAYLVQRDILSIDAILISIPQGLLVALVLFANNARDIEFDRDRKIKTLGMVQGGHKNIKIFIGFIALTYIYTLLLIIFNVFSLLALIIFLSLPFAIKLCKEFKEGFPDAADALTSKLVVLYGGLLCIVLVLEKII